MSPMLALEAITAPDAEPITIDLLTPEDPALQREMASFHANALLRHLITLVAAGEAHDAGWLADVRGCLAGMAQVLG